MPQAASPAGHRHVNPWVVLVLVCIAQFMVVLDATVVSVALQAIKAGLDFSTSDLEWIVNGYTLTFGGFLLFGGRAGDLFGRQRVFLVGLALFSGASLFNGLAQSPTMLILGRTIQGLGGALISPAALSIITTTFAEGAERNKAMSVWSAIAAGGAAFGLLLGGILTQSASWRWIFFINVPIGIVAFLLAMRLVPDTRLHGQRGVDVIGAVAVTGGLMAVVYAITEASTLGWGSATTIVWGAIGIVLLVAFLVRQARFRSPLVRLSIFRTRSLSVANLAMFVVAGGMFAMFFFLSLYMEGILRFKPLETGLAFLPFCFGIGIGAGLAQALIKRVDARLLTVIGMAIAGAGYILLTRISTTDEYWTTVFPAFLFVAGGMGLTFVPVTLIATTNIASDDAGLASGLLNTSQQVGGALGLAILSTLAVNRTTAYLSGLGHAPAAIDLAAGTVRGYKVAFISGVILFGVAALILLAGLRRRDIAGIAGASAEEETAMATAAG